MKKASAVITAIMVLNNFSFAISVTDVVPIYVSSNAISVLLDEIAYSIEPYAKDWMKDWNHPIAKKEVEAKIISAINKLSSQIWADDLWTIYFTQALLWHYYYQMENEKGYFVCDSISKVMQKQFPQKYESFWLDGVNKIKAGRVAEGFAVLDSLYVNSNVSSSFLNEYSLLSKKCFVPRNYENDRILTGGGAYDNFYFSPKETKPVLSFWKTEERDGRVSFIFTERYSFIENFQIKYPKLYKDEEFEFDVKIDEKISREVKKNVLWEPARAAPHPVVYTITVDRGKQELSLFEYLVAIVYKRFDYISEIKPPLHKDGISVRGGSYNVIRGVSGESVIYTLYDYETFGNTQEFYTTPNTLKNVKPTKNRVIVSLETTQKMEPKAIDFYIDVVNGNFVAR